MLYPAQQGIYGSVRKRRAAAGTLSSWYDKQIQIVSPVGRRQLVAQMRGTTPFRKGSGGF
jgi:hypothetical protein